jgi:hypothetical protein
LRLRDGGEIGKSMNTGDVSRGRAGLSWRNIPIALRTSEGDDLGLLLA